MTKDTYAEIFDKSVVVHNKKNGKRIAQLMNEGENFTQVFSNGSTDKVYTLSNFGLKKWKLETNSAPTLYASSDKLRLSKIYFGEN